MKRYLLIILIFSVTAVLSLFLYYQQIKPEDVFNVNDFPRQIADYNSEDIPVEENVYEILETRNLLLRKYKKNDEPDIALYIIYSDKNRKASHPPEVCLIGSGVSILKKTQEKLILQGEGDTIAVNNLLVEKSKRQEIMLYWFKAGKTFTANYLSQQFKIMLSQLQGKSSGGAMIRLSTQITKDKEEAKERLEDFISAISPVIVKVIQ